MLPPDVPAAAADIESLVRDGRAVTVREDCWSGEPWPTLTRCGPLRVGIEPHWPRRWRVVLCEAIQ